MDWERDSDGSEVELTFGVGRWRGVLLVGESPSVVRGDVNCTRGTREEELVARSVDVDAERELLEPLGYEEGRSSDRDAWIELAADAARGGVRREAVRGQPLSTGRDMLSRGAGEAPCEDTACRPASFGYDVRMLHIRMCRIQDRRT
jgi:hypothetical protein